MHQKSHIIGIVAAAAMLVATQSSSASAAPQAACSLLTLAEVRAIVGSTVEIYQPSSAGPTVHGVNTVSNCVYMPHGTADTWKGAGSGFYSLMWGPAASLTTGYNIYMQRHWLARIKGDVLVTATVSNGRKLDPKASGKLLEAVLKKL
jgi:hypothetical protein